MFISHVILLSDARRGKQLGGQNSATPAGLVRTTAAAAHPTNGRVWSRRATLGFETSAKELRNKLATPFNRLV